MIDVQVIGMRKGGVGKSTSCINLAAEYAALGIKTLVIDGESQANVTKTFGFDCDKLDQQTSDIFEGNYADPSKVILKTEYDNLWLVPSSKKLEVVLANAPMGFERAISRFLKKVWNDFEYVVIDTPPGVNIVTTSAMEASSSILLPIQCEEFSLQGISDMTHAISKAQEVLNENLKLRGVFLTMVNERLAFTKFAIQEINDYFKENTFKTYIRRSVAVTEAQNAHKPLRYYDPKNNASIDYYNLAREVVNRL